jgi:hypothetical protein
MAEVVGDSPSTQSMSSAHADHHQDSPPGAEGATMTVGRNTFNASAAVVGQECPTYVGRTLGILARRTMDILACRRMGILARRRMGILACRRMGILARHHAIGLKQPLRRPAGMSVSAGRSVLIRLAKWLRGEEESHFESLLGDSGIAVRCPRQVRAVVVVRPRSGNPFAHPAATHNPPSVN